MTTNPDVLRLARSITAESTIIMDGDSQRAHNRAAEILAGKCDNESVALHVAIAAIERTTVLSGTLAKKVGQCANTSGRGSCCETLGEDIERDLLDYDHLRQPEKGKSQAKSSEVSNCSCGGPCSRCLNKCQCSACCHTT